MGNSREETQEERGSYDESNGQEVVDECHAERHDTQGEEGEETRWTQLRKHEDEIEKRDSPRDDSCRED